MIHRVFDPSPSERAQAHIKLSRSDIRFVQEEFQVRLHFRIGSVREIILAIGRYAQAFELMSIHGVECDELRYLLLIAGNDHRDIEIEGSNRFQLSFRLLIMQEGIIPDLLVVGEGRLLLSASCQHDQCKEQPKAECEETNSAHYLKNTL